MEEKPQIVPVKVSREKEKEREKPPAPGSCIFIGNIPYDSTDADIERTLKLVGPFNQFRLKIDKHTN